MDRHRDARGAVQQRAGDRFELARECVRSARECVRSARERSLMVAKGVFTAAANPTPEG